MVSVTPAVGRSLVAGAQASSSVKLGAPGTPVSQIHEKVKGAGPCAGPQCEFPALLTLVQTARWIQAARGSH